MVLSRSWSTLQWASAVRGSLLMLLLSSSSMHVKLSLVSRPLPPQIVHELAVAADAEVVGLEWVVTAGC